VVRKKNVANMLIAGIKKNKKSAATILCSGLIMINFIIF